MTLFLDPQTLKTATEAALKQTPDDHRNALIGSIDSTGTQFVALFKLDQDRWIASALARHDWTGENTIGASLIYSW